MIIRNLNQVNVNEIKDFTITEDKQYITIIMVNGKNIECEMKTAFDICKFYELMKKIESSENIEKIIYTSINGYVTRAKSSLMIQRINNITLMKNINISAHEILTVIIDKFHLCLSNKNDNLDKYILMAVNCLQ